MAHDMTEEVARLVEALRACAKEMGRIHNADAYEKARVDALAVLKDYPEKAEG